MTRILQIFILTILITNCSDSGKILDGHNFEKGDWLFVNVNYAENTLELIEDESILKNNKNGIWVTPMGDCGGATCDWFIKLYKDGKLIAQDEYLTRSALYESSEIKNGYQNGTEWTINPVDEIEFRHLWDSLKNEKVCGVSLHGST